MEVHDGEGGTSLHSCRPSFQNSKSHSPKRGPQPLSSFPSPPPSQPPDIPWSTLLSTLKSFLPVVENFQIFQKKKKALFFLIQYAKLVVKGSNHKTSNFCVHFGLHTSPAVVFPKDIDPSFLFALVLLASSTWVLTLKETFPLGSTDLLLDTCPYFFLP